MASRSIILYALSIGLVSGSNFLSVPILVQLLGTEEFARWVLIEPIILAGAPLAIIGVQFGLLRRISGDGKSAKEAVSEVFPFVLPGMCLGTIAVFAVCHYLGEGRLALPTVAIVILEAIILLSVSCWRAEGKASLYALTEGGRALTVLIVLGAALFIVHYPGAETQDYLALRLGAAALAACIAISWLRPEFRPSFPSYKSALSYGTPILVGSILSIGLMSFDRYFVESYAGRAEVTAYVAHIKFSLIVTMAITAPFHTWFAPEAIRRGTNISANRDFFEETTVWYFFALLWGVGNIWFMLPWAWPFLFPVIEYNPALFAILLGAAIFYGMGMPLSAGLIQPGKTIWNPVVFSVAIGLMMGAGLILTPDLGVIGASLARLAGMACFASLFAVGTVRILGLHLPWGACLSALLWFALTVWFVQQFQFDNRYLGVISAFALFNIVFVPPLGLAHRRTRSRLRRAIAS